MKKLRLSFLFGVLCAFLFALASCGKYTLSRPTRVYIDSDALILHWDEIDGADRYVVSVSGKEEEVNKNEYSLVSLEAGDYELKVKARDKDEKYKESVWSDTVSFTREAESGVRYRLTNNKTAYEAYGIGSASGAIVIPETYRGKPVTKIAEKAFSGENRLTSIEIGENVTELGDRAFFMCSNLTNVTFKGNVSSFGSYVFQSCSKLESIELPEGLTVLPTDAFSYCRRLESVTFPSTLMMVSDNAFKDCSALKSVEFPSATLIIGSQAFQNCTALENVNLGGVLSVGTYAFSGDVALQNVNFSKVQTIGNYAFNGCTALTEAEIPDTASSVGEGVFYDCTALETAKIGKNVTAIGAFAFYNTKLWNDATDLVYADRWCVGYKSESALDELRIAAPTSSTTRKYAVWNADTVGIAEQTFMIRTRNASGGYDVSGDPTISVVQIPERMRYIGKNAFRSAVKLVQVQIGTGVEKIGDYAFAGCAALQSLQMPVNGASLKAIGNFAFMGSAKLSTITNNLPDSLEEIGTQAFVGTAIWPKKDTNGIVYSPDKKWALGVSGTVKEANILEGTVGVAKYAFYKSESITAASFPESLQYVNYGAFYQCKVLTTVSFADCRDFRSLGAYAFYQCAALESATLPGKLKTLESSTFSGCPSLSALNVGSMKNTLPTTLESIGDYAFSNCTSLTALTMPDSLRSIGAYAFNSSGIVNLVLGKNVDTIGDRAFRNNANLTNVDFGDSLTSVGSRAFYNCTALQKVIFPDTMLSVGDYAFYGCTAVDEITLNEGLLSIGRYSFFGCSGVMVLTFPSTLESIGDHAFRACSALQSIIIPSSVETIGKHVFFACREATIFAEAESAPEGFDAMWNSSYRPVVWGCSLSWDKTYVVSVTKNEKTVSYATEKNPVGSPIRDGYSFSGWTSVQGGTTAEYAPAEIVSVPDGTTLYAVWGDPDEKGRTYVQSDVSMEWTSEEAKEAFLGQMKMTEEQFLAYLRLAQFRISFGYDGTVKAAYIVSEETAYYKIENGVLTFYATAEDMANGNRITDENSLFTGTFTISEDMNTLTIVDADEENGVSITMVFH